MLSRFSIAALLASILPLCILHVTCHAQQNDIVIGSQRDYSIGACSPDGRTLFKEQFAQEQNFGHSSWNPQHSHWALLGISRDGLTITYQLPEGLEPSSATYDGSDVLVLARDFEPQSYHPPDPPPAPHIFMLRFDNQANLLTQQRSNIDLMPGNMVVLPSGKIILLGRYRSAGQDDDKNMAVVLDADGKILSRVPFPLPPEGGGWTIQSRMVAGEGAAYLVLFSYDPSTTGIARISEDGSFNVKIIPNTPYDDVRHHTAWMAGPGVAVEVYHYVDPRERSTFHFDEYNVNTGEKMAYRYAFSAGGGFGCYSHEEVSMLAPSFHVDPARGLSPDTMRLVFSRLHDQPVSAPVVNPEAPPCTSTDEKHALPTVH